jgi:hypothetical protein
VSKRGAEIFLLLQFTRWAKEDPPIRQESTVHRVQGQLSSLIPATSGSDASGIPRPRALHSRSDSAGMSSDDLFRRAAITFSDEPARQLARDKCSPYAESMAAKLRTAADVAKAKDLCYQQSMHGRVLSEQDKTWLHEYQEGIKAQQTAKLREADVMPRS